MFRYAVNLDPDLTICDCESKWDAENGWTEEMYTGDIYKCQLVECSYEDASANDFYDDDGIYKFDEDLYWSHKNEYEFDNELMSQESLLINIQRRNTLMSLDDEEAFSVRYMHPEWAAETKYKKGERFIYKRKLYKCSKDHISTEEYTPDYISDVNLISEDLTPLYIEIKKSN